MKLNKLKFNTKVTPVMDLDEDDLISNSSHLGSEFLGFYSQVIPIRQVEVFLDEGIREPKYYRSIIQMLGTLQQHDTCTFYVETPGGNADGILALCEAVDASEGQIQAIITGQASSAGSMFALRCPNVGVAPNARMMIHAASFGYGGKHMDAVRGMEFQNKWLSKVFRQAYEGFLTEEEIQLCIEGKEFWFLSEEIVQRLEAREDYLEQKALAEEIPEEVPEVKPKPKVQKSRVKKS